MKLYIHEIPCGMVLLITGHLPSLLCVKYCIEFWNKFFHLVFAGVVLSPATWLAQCPPPWWHRPLVMLIRLNPLQFWREFLYRPMPACCLQYCLYAARKQISLNSNLLVCVNYWHLTQNNNDMNNLSWQSLQVLHVCYRLNEEQISTTECLQVPRGKNLSSCGRKISTGMQWRWQFCVLLICMEAKTPTLLTQACL